MNKKQRQHLRRNPLDWTPRLQEEALDCIENLEAKLDQEGTEPGQLASIARGCNDLRGKASTPEPPPEASERSEPVFPFIIEELRNAKYNTETSSWLADLLEERRNFGIEKYGQELHTHNGRDAIEDARQEFGDLVVYLTQGVLEGRANEVQEFLSKMEILTSYLHLSKR